MTPVELIASGVLVMVLVPIIAFDIHDRRIPNDLNLALAATGLAFRVVAAPSWTAVGLALLAPIAVIAMLVGLIGAMKLLRRPGTLGLGDVKFLAAASLWVGFVGATLVFVVASLLALLFTLARMPWRRLDLRAAIPFGPFLAVSLVLIFATNAALA